MADEREMLKLAAKAMGFAKYEWEEGAGIYMYDAGWHKDANALFVDSSYYWNPRIDSGQAFEMAVRLGIQVYGREIGGSADDEVFIDEADCGGDPVAATRLAVTTVAANKGRAM